MKTPQSTLDDIFKDQKIMNLKPHTLKAYLYFIYKANGKVIPKFSIRKQAEEWGLSPELQLTDNKNTVSNVIKELVSANLIKVDFDSKTLEIL